MDIKKANLSLLLGKIRVYLDSVPPEKRRGKKYVEASKALAKLEKVFAGKEGELQLVACRKDQHVYPT